MLATERQIGLRYAAAGLAAVAIVAVPFLVIFYPAFSGGPSALEVPGREDAVRYSFRWWDYFVPSITLRAVGGWRTSVVTVP
jgi:hypothetical protein